MAKGKKHSNEPKGRKITLKMAKNAVRLTVDGKRCLDLSNMQIATFPKCILKLSDVDELDLSRNLLEKLPDRIDKFAGLRRLDLHSNRLSRLPETIGRLQGLRSLDLSNNRLSAAGLPHELGLLRGLRSLNLGLNQLETLPTSVLALRELRELGLFDNRLASVPACLRNLPKLQSVNVRGNPIPPEHPPELDTIRRAEGLYLVRESCLCADCLRKCKEQRGRADSRLSGGVAHKKSHTFAGLITPNSVAQEDQSVWR